MDVAAQIKAARKALGWNQARLAVEADVGIATVSNTERGASSPDDATLHKLCTALGITIERPARVFGAPPEVPQADADAEPGEGRAA